MHGNVVYVYACDIAHEADLTAIEKMMRGTERFRLGHAKDAPGIFRSIGR